MTLVIPQASDVAMLQAILAQADSLRLYTNNHVPSLGDTSANYIEASGGGYGAASLTPASWTITPGSPADGRYPQTVFLFTGSVGAVYGFYVVDAGGSLLWAERFTDGPYLIANNGDDVKVTLVFQFGGQ